MKTTKLLPANTTTAMPELYKLLLKSEKILNWKPKVKPTWNELPCRTTASPEPSRSSRKTLHSRRVAELWGVNPVMRMVRAYLCRFVPSISASCNSGYNRLHGTQFAKGLAGRFCLSVVHLVLDGSCLSGCRGG